MVLAVPLQILTANADNRRLRDDFTIHDGREPLTFPEIDIDPPPEKDGAAE